MRAYHFLSGEASTPIAAAATATVGASARLKDEECTIRRRRALRRVDRALEKGNYKTALSLVKQLQGQHGGLLGFGAIKLDPKRMFSVNELQNRKIDTSLNGLSPGQDEQSLVETIMHSIKCCRLFALEDGDEEEEEEVSSSGLDSSVDDESGDSPSRDHLMCLQHEAGHFLVGYLLGLLPKKYEVPSLEDLQQDRFARGKVEFLGFEFLSEVDTAVTSHKNTVTGRLSNETLNRFLCVILGGLVAEHLLFGFSELLHSDVKKLDEVLKWLGFTEDEANFRVRRAALSAIIILSQHQYARIRLAEVMASRRSVGCCICAVEDSLNPPETIQSSSTSLATKIKVSPDYIR